MVGEQRRMSVITAAPTPATFEGIVNHFAQGGEGIVTAFNDAFGADLLPLLDRHPLLDGKPFPTLLRLCAQASGVDNGAIASGTEMIAAVRGACRDQGSEGFFGRVAKYPAFHRIVATTMAEIAEFGYTPERLREAHLEDPHLRKKIDAFADLMSATYERLGRRGLTTMSRLITSMLPEVPELDASTQRLLVFTGATFAPAKLDLLKWLDRHGAAVTVVMDASEGSHTYQGTRQSLEWLQATPSLSHNVNRLVDRLFRTAPTELDAPELEGGITIVSAGDGLAECEWALREIIAAPDIETVIVARQADQYAPLLEAASRRLGVNLRIRRGEPLLTNGFARTFLSLIES
ncbi:MAG: hypothetical protein C4320_08380, partial [Armatimonadota bacterium]